MRWVSRLAAAAGLFAVPLLTVTAGSQGRQTSPRVELLAAPRGQTRAALRPLTTRWSFDDDADSIVVRVTAAAQDAGVLLADVQVQAAPVVWEDSSHESPDYERSMRGAEWLPAVIARRVDLGNTGVRLGNRGVLIGVVHPDRLQRNLGGGRPGLLLTALRVNVWQPGAAGTAGRRVTRQIQLFMAD